MCCWALSAVLFVTVATDFRFCRARPGSVRSTTLRRCCRIIATSVDWRSTERSNTKTPTLLHQPCQLHFTAFKFIWNKNTEYVTRLRSRSLQETFTTWEMDVEAYKDLDSWTCIQDQFFDFSNIDRDRPFLTSSNITQKNVDRFSWNFWGRHRHKEQSMTHLDVGSGVWISLFITILMCKYTLFK